MKTGALLAALPLLGLFLFSSCASPLRAIVCDSNGLQKEVTHVTTDRGGKVEVLDGLARREIALDKIHSMLISPEATLSQNGELYYQTEIWLTDSTRILAYALPDGSRSNAYVNVYPTILAKTRGGSFAIKLKDVKQIRFIREKP